MTTTGIIIGLLIAAVILLLLEVLTPSFGLLACLAIAALGAAVWQAFTINSLFGGLLVIAILILIPVYLTFMVHLLPKTPLGKRLFLKKAPSADAAATPETETLDSLVGKTAVTETMLRPSGAIRIDGKRIIALSESGLIRKGKTVKIIRAAGTNVIVRKT